MNKRELDQVLSVFFTAYPYEVMLKHMKKGTLKGKRFLKYEDCGETNNNARLKVFDHGFKTNGEVKFKTLQAQIFTTRDLFLVDGTEKKAAVGEEAEENAEKEEGEEEEEVDEEEDESKKKVAADNKNKKYYLDEFAKRNKFSYMLDVDYSRFYVSIFFRRDGKLALSVNVFALQVGDIPNPAYDE